MFLILFFQDKRKRIFNKLLKTDTAAQENEKNILTYGFIKWFLKLNLSITFSELLSLIIILISSEILIFLFFQINVWLLIFIAATTIFIIFVILKFVAGFKNAKKENQLEQFLIELIGHIYSNPNMQNCILKTILNLEEPLKSDIQRIVDDCSRGVLFKEAVKRFIERSSSQIIEVVFTGIIAANEKGINIVDFLRFQLEYIREKKSINNYIKILSTSPKYTSYFIMAIPMAVILIVIFINKNFMSFYFRGIGLLIILYSILSYLIGFILINKIINNLSREFRAR